jgi:MinD-like ATPase involved in chromosome partitioning or flagellar assembly
MAPRISRTNTGARKAESVALELAKGRDAEPLRSLIGKSFAIASGKGGVGKTITASNLGIYYARKGLATAIVDLDPLSDVAALLDVTEAEAAFTQSLKDESPEVRDLADFRIALFPKLDLLFPALKGARFGSDVLLELLFRRFAAELDATYQVLIFDLPAGSQYDDNLVYLAFVKTLVLVANPEPTSHASAGAYVKRVLERYPDRRFCVWHNRYAEDPGGEFDPKDIVGNYNRYSPPDQQLGADARIRLRNVAFVPEDPSLNLLRGSASILASGFRALLDSLAYLHERRLVAIASNLMISEKVQEYVRHYIVHHPRIDDVDAYLTELGTYIRRLAALKARRPLPSTPEGESVFTDEERHTFHAFLQIVKKDPIRVATLRISRSLREKVETLDNAQRAFFVGAPIQADKALDTEIARLLVALDRAVRSNAELRNPAALLLFHFSISKLLQSETLVKLIRGFIPARKGSRGGKVRDRYRQIRNLITRDKAYRSRYLTMVKTLFPVVMAQLSSMAKTLSLSHLILRDDENRVRKQAYLALFNSFLHDLLHSGLSVIVGFDYRSASLAFRDGAERILRVGADGAETAARRAR